MAGQGGHHGRNARAARLRACAAAVVALGLAATAHSQPVHAQGAAAAQPPAPRATPAMPARPDEPRAAKTYGVLDAHCARCHQTGRTETPLPSGGLANILAIDDLSRDGVLVKPGLPDASRLYDILITRHAPLDVYTDAPDGAEPRPDDIEMVRDWIKDLPADRQTCRGRPPRTPDDIDALMREALAVERDGAKDVRFISLQHLYNACASDAEMAGYKQALIKLINGLSWTGEPVKPQPLDPQGSVFSFKLSELGWVGGHWDLIQRAYPATLTRAVPPDIAAKSGTALPLINGDWLAAAASETPLYYQLLGIPAKLGELAKMNGVDIDQDIRQGGSRRIAIKQSAVTRGNRLLERHPGARGGFWMVYDFATSTGDQDIFERPLGPKSATSSKTPFKPDQVRVLFQLPNGFMAAALYDASGNRIERVLPGIEKPYRGDEAAALEPATKAGGACFTCHRTGAIGARDEFRATVQPPPVPAPASVSAPAAEQQQGEAAPAGMAAPGAAAPAVPAAPAATTPPAAPVPTNPAREAALALFASDSENALLISADADRYRAALALVGVDAGLTIHGHEPVAALARRYTADQGLEQALAETGMTREAFLAKLGEAEGPAAPLARRLLLSAMPRADLDRLIAYVQGRPAPEQTKSSGGFLREVKSEIGLSLWVDKPNPVEGDLVSVKAEADADCYLSLISVDAQGKATVLFPNDFELDNLILAGKTMSVPGPDAPYQLRFKADGTEMLLARCSSSAAPPVGIEHDFERQRFTVLGNWENFIQDTLVTEAELRKDSAKAERARAAKAQAASRRRSADLRLEDRPTIAASKALRDGRAVLVLGAK